MRDEEKKRLYDQKYCEAHREQRRIYAQEYHKAHKEQETEYSRVHKEGNSRRQRAYYQRHTELCRERGKIRKRLIREQALNVLGGAKCINCGCNVFEILEINHINGGGTRELKNMGNAAFIRKIINGDVDITQYNVLCKICNTFHYVNDILGISGHRVIWDN